MASLHAHVHPAERPGRVILPESALAELSTGGGSAEVIGRLRKSEHSRRLVLLRAFLDAAQESPDAATGPLTPITEAWQALERAERQDPGAVAELLTHPQVGSWLAYTLRRHRHGTVSDAPIWQDFGGLHALAVVAAAATGQEYSARLPLRAGRVLLPRLGMASFGGCAEWDLAEATTTGGEISLRHGRQVITVPPAGDDDRWWALRRLTVGDDNLRLTVWLDDLDPMRDLADPVPPARLSGTAATRWTELLHHAWKILTEHHRPLAQAIAAGLSSLVPLPAGDGWDTRSASTGDAFGAIMCSLPPDPTTFAVSLTHEFMHIKLGALMHLYTMTDNTATARLYAPWRDDPRPAAGLLQGIYAFFGIAEFWRRQRSAAGNPLTDFEYAYARAQTQEALETALSDGALTGHGRRFAEQLAGEVLGWSGDPIDEDAREQVRLVVEGHRAGWRIRHCRPDPADVAAIVRALKSGASAKVTIALSQVQPDPAMRHWSAGRLGLARRRLVAPEQLTEVRDEEWGAALTDADLALVTGEPTKAAAGFTDQIGRDPESADAWTGLGLALSAGGGKSHILVDRPEVVLAVHRELHTRHDPAHLAARVAACLPTEPE